jgi:hypothetical protein
MALVKKGIELAWPSGLEVDKPRWMRKRNALPCACEKCYHCFHNITSGIDHRRSFKARVSKAPVPTKRCNPKREVLFKKGTSIPVNDQRYCKVCYDKARVKYAGMISTGINKDPGYQSSRYTQEKECRHTKKGCRTCSTRVCEGCWAEFQHGGPRTSGGRPATIPAEVLNSTPYCRNKNTGIASPIIMSARALQFDTPNTAPGKSLSKSNTV